MNNLDIIKKISKKAGTPETEANIFFEILVKKISKVLKDGEKLKLDDVGFFRLNETDGNKVVSFSQIGKSDSEDHDSVSYLINDLEPSEEDPVDSFFSISLDKPEIPINEKVDAEFFIPPTGSELLSFMNSKADDILLESRIIKTDEQLPETIQENISETHAEDEELNLEKLSSEEEIKKPEEINDEVKSKIEMIEEKDLSLEKLSSEDEIKKPEEIKDEFKSETERVEEKDLNLENLSQDEIKKTKEFNDGPKAEEELGEIKKGFEEETSDIKLSDSISSAELSELKDNFYKDELDETEKEKEPEEAFEEKQKEEKRFQRVNSLSSAFDKKNKDIIKDDDNLNKNIDRVEVEKADEKGFSKVKFKRIVSLENMPEEDDEIISEDEREKNLIDEKEKLNVRKRKRKIPILPILIVIAAIAVFFLYRFFVNSNQPEKPAVKNPQTLLPSNPKIINRNYDIAVNYPYKKGNDLLFDGIDPAVLSEANQNKTVKNNDVKPADVKTIASEKPTSNKTEKNNNPAITQDQNDLENAKPIPSDNYKQVTNYIYTNGKNYFIQVSSWKVLWRAEKHNSNLQKKGYNSSVEKLISPEGRIYYIVKIGSYNSLKEAENYLAKH